MNHSDYDGWKSIQNVKITKNGKWTVFEENPQDGDGKLIIKAVEKRFVDSISRGQSAQLTGDDRFAIYRIVPPKDSVKAAKRKKTKKEDMPKNSLGIFDFGTDTKSEIPNVLSFKLPEKQGSWLAYALSPAKTPKGAKKESEKNGSKLVLMNLLTQSTDTIHYVTEYAFPKLGTKLAYISTGDDSTSKAGVIVLDLETKSRTEVFISKGKQSKLSFSEDGAQLAFIADIDTNTTTLRRNPQLMYWQNAASQAIVVADSSKNPASNGWSVSADYTPSFSKNGMQLFFGTKPPYPVKDTTVLEEDVVQVDVWNYRDVELMPQQLANLERLKKQSYLAVYHPKLNKTVQLATLDVPSANIVDEGNASFVIGGSDLPYSNQHWDWSGTADVYVISTLDGTNSKIATAQKTGYGGANASPKGEFTYWYSKADTAWFAYHLKGRKIIRLTSGTSFSDAEEDDHPDYPNPYGLAGWSEKDSRVFIYDRYDIWSIDPLNPKDAVNLTKGRGQKTRYRYIKTDEEARNIETKTLQLVHVFKEVDKQSGYASLDFSNGVLQEKILDKASFSRQVYKAKDATIYLYTRESFQEFPDLHLSKTLNFKEAIKWTDTNPQQKDINWGTVELVRWKSLNGEMLQGLLYKPEGFDASKKYPMITYYYEKNSDNLYDYHVPQPVRASVNYAYYVSNGYLLFVPDVVYTDGYPGKSAYDCVIPGVLSIVDLGFVDKAKLGIQGHSWGGYQNAYLITKTNLFAAAEAGAPVANMTSAYGGIRWDTGLSRMAQYERNQSRIGATLWEKPMHYLENSPLFYIPNIETPLLMMHNDADGAVPWYQGIEMFMGMKRLDKPVWMLNYNGEKHGLIQRKNRKDWTVRMQQFFDHYLKDAPMPIWMKEGVPAVNKTLEYGFELED